MICSVLLFLAVLGTCVSSASRATPAPLVPRALTPSTVTLSATLSPTAPGAPTSEQIITLTLNPSPDKGPAFTVSAPAGYPDEDGVPDNTPQCASLDALLHSCTSVVSFFVLPLIGQAECLCNVGPWDAVASACYDQLTVLGQYYASSLTSHGLLDMCSTFKLGPTWPASVVASVSATSTPLVGTTETSVGTMRSSGVGNTTQSSIPSSSQSSTESSIQSATRNNTQSSSQSPTQIPTQSTTDSATQSATAGSGSLSIARPSLLVWLMLWLLAL